MKVRGKVVIVTGASSGIGLATARLFARAGGKVVLVARSADKLEAEARRLRDRGLEAVAIPADMRLRPDVDSMVAQTLETYGRIDIAINNAGQAAVGRVDSLGEDAVRRMFDLNLFGPFYLIQAVVPAMRRQGGGLIINISSMVTKFDVPTLGAYSASKHALNSLSHSARQELAADNIRVVTVYPSQTNSRSSEDQIDQRTERTRYRHMWSDTPEHVATMILRAAHREPRDQYMAPALRVLGAAHELVPGLFDRMIMAMANRRA